MNAKEKLIAVMELKANRLPKLSPAYFNEADRRAMLKWNDERCKDTVDEMIYEISNGIEAGKIYCNLGTSTCAFCFYHQDSCEFCEYADITCDSNTRWGNYSKAARAHSNYGLKLAEILDILEEK